MKILLFSTNDECYFFLKFCFPCATIEVAYTYQECRRTLVNRHYDLVCYECNPLNPTQSFNRLTYLLELHPGSQFVALSECALRESQSLALWKKGIGGILSLKADYHDVINDLQKILLGARRLGNPAEIAIDDSVQANANEQRRHVRKLNTIKSKESRARALSEQCC